MLKRLSRDGTQGGTATTADIKHCPAILNIDQFQSPVRQRCMTEIHKLQLDIGCGGGATLQRLLKRSEGSKVYGIDISEESVAKARKVNAEVLDKRVFITQGSAEKLPYEDGKFDLVTAVETVYFWPNLADCLQEVRRVLKQGGKFAILVEVIDGDSMWTNVVEGMTAYSPEELKTLLDDAGFIQTEIHRMKPSNATIIGVKA